MSTSRTREKADGELFKSTGIDDNATSTAITIDASENVLVGKTTTAFGTAGIELNQNGVAGKTWLTRSGGEPLTLNRLSSDGQLVAFYKDGGTSVGSIGTYGSALYIASPDGSDAGLRIGNSYISPVTTTGVNRDAGIDLGHPNSRFKDLYLSGGVVFGPASASNVSSQTLDSYEEGTWTPTGVAFTVTSIESAKYTKIGQQVTVVGYIQTSSGAGSPATIGGLPFTSRTGGYSFAGVNIAANNPTMYNLQLRVGSNSTDMNFHQNNDTTVAGTNVDGGHIIFTATYFTNS